MVHFCKILVQKNKDLVGNLLDFSYKYVNFPYKFSKNLHKILGLKPKNFPSILGLKPKNFPSILNN